MEKVISNLTITYKRVCVKCQSTNYMRKFFVCTGYLEISDNSNEGLTLYVICEAGLRSVGNACFILSRCRVGIRAMTAAEDSGGLLLSLDEGAAMRLHKRSKKSPAG